MDKNFASWNLMKTEIHNDGHQVFCHPREIWWCALGTNIGYEQDGTGEQYDRPVLILKVFSSNVFLAIPLTGREKAGRYYFPLGVIDGRQSTAILSQVRLLDTKRLIRKMCTLDEARFNELKSTLVRVVFD